MAVAAAQVAQRQGGSSLAMVKESEVLKAAVIAGRAKRAPPPARTIENRIEESLLCAICKEIVINAMSPECGHLFCTYCLLNGALKSPESIAIPFTMDGFSLVCPVCRERQFRVCASTAIDRLVVDLYPERAAERSKQMIDDKLRDYMLPAIRKRVADKLEAEELERQIEQIRQREQHQQQQGIDAAIVEDGVVPRMHPLLYAAGGPVPAGMRRIHYDLFQRACLWLRNSLGGVNYRPHVNNLGIEQTPFWDLLDVVAYRLNALTNVIGRLLILSLIIVIPLAVYYLSLIAKNSKVLQQM